MEVRTRTWKSYGDTLRLHVIPVLGSKLVEEVDTWSVQQLLDGLAETSGAHTSNYARTVLNAAMNQALKWQIIGRNPVHGTVKKSESPKERTIWTSDETRSFLSVSSGHRLHALFYVALATGLRSGELFGLRWSDVTDDAIHVRCSVSTRNGTVVESEPKSKSSRRIVAIDPATRKVLEEHRINQEKELSLFGGDVVPERVFTNQLGKTLDSSNVSKIWHRLQAEAGVPRARMHDARHMHITRLLAVGVDIRTVSDRAGHADTVLTLRQYAHALEARKKRAAIPLDDLLD